MGGGKVAPRGERRSKAFHIAMAAVAAGGGAADGGVAGIPVQRPRGFPHGSCREPPFRLERRGAAFPIGNSRDSPSPRPNGFGGKTRRVVRPR